MFAVLAAAAEYENELCAERHADGIAAAKRRETEGRMLPGKKRIGRPRTGLVDALARCHYAHTAETRWGGQHVCIVWEFSSGIGQIPLGRPDTPRRRQP
ncbi:hypothetical protein, partial [Streptomyces sp. HG99]|uniref:hypothetical protein n=1 Tax=Streptomyces sp. HG99 TaxID=1958787 RepID=UPI001C556AEF